MNYWVYEDDQTDRVRVHKATRMQLQRWSRDKEFLVFPTIDGMDLSALNKKLDGTPWKPVALTPEDAGFACVLLKVCNIVEIMRRRRCHLLLVLVRHARRAPESNARKYSNLLRQSITSRVLCLEVADGI